MSSKATTKIDPKLLNQEEVILEFTEAFAAAIRKAGITRSELARRAGRSRPHITQCLSGERNLTLRTIADLCLALDASIRVNIVLKGEKG